MKFQTLIHSYLLVSLILSLPFTEATAVEIVRLELEYGGDGVATGGYAFPKVNRTLDLELYDDSTPVTVANFLDYVDNQLYDLTFFNRSIPGFVIQTGGVTNITDDPENQPLGPDTFGEVPEFGPIINEPGLSNTRGTIAMAKLSGQPDSATSEWYINLDDNSNPLDTDNDGYTVFGRVIDNDMDVADEVASFPTTDLSFLFGSAYTDLPLADYDIFGSEIAYQRNLVMILTARTITRPIARTVPANGKLGNALVGDPALTTFDVLIQNTGNEQLVVNSVNTSALSTPFSFVSEDCTASVLAPITTSPASSCTVRIMFSPDALEIYSSSFTVDYSSTVSMDTFQATYTISAEGTLGDPEITVNSSLNLGVSQVNGQSVRKQLLVKNTGLASLQISSIIGLRLTDFSQTNDCVGTETSIAVGETCTIMITYSATTSGSASATLSLNTNDPANPVTNIAISGYGDIDTDGIPAPEEIAGPNLGDGNNDGIQDDSQNNVTTYLMNTSKYVTLVSDAVTSSTNANVNGVTYLSEVSSISDIPADAPAGTSFDYGLSGFNVNFPSGFTGGSVKVALFLPVGVMPSKYYKFGPTPDNTTPHWYDFAFDSNTRTGVNFIGNVSIGSPSGTSINRNMILLSFVDGEKGDDDLTANGVIIHGEGGTSFNHDMGSSGSAVYLWLSGLVFLLRLRAFDPGNTSVRQYKLR